MKICNYFINITEEDISQEFRLKKIKEIDNYLIKEVDQNELLSNKSKKDCTTLNYIEHFLNLVSTVTVCIFISAFASFFFAAFISKGVMSSTIGLNICVIISRIKICKIIIKKNKKNHDEMALLAKTKLDCIRDLTDLYIKRNYFSLIDVLRNMII